MRKIILKYRFTFFVMSATSIVIYFSIVYLNFLFNYATITYIEVKYPLLGKRALPGSPWPMPISWISELQQVTINPQSFYLFSNARYCDVIDDALKRYEKLIFFEKLGKKHPNLIQLNGVRIIVSENYKCGYPQLGDDESYNLQIPSIGDAIITSVTIWGAIRGLETFSQLIYLDASKNYLLNVSVVQDSPRFQYRGILLDTARHYLPVKTIKMNLDAMAYNKFNAFHWHIVDDQSFPFESKKFPNITRLAAYSPKHVYTQEQIRDIIRYARLRGIRVIPELDTPGHTQALGKAFPWIITPCYGGGPDKPYTPNYTNHSSAEILNPMINDTYRIVRQLIEEFMEVFVDDYIHLGMDEVYYACWESNPEIANFMKKRGFTEYNEVEQYYVTQTLINLKEIGYKYMLYQDPIDNNVEVDRESIIELWRYCENKNVSNWENCMEKIVKKKYKIILSACWYLNHISYGPDWKEFYKCDPRNFEGTNEEKDLIIGGEACMWGEYVDATNLLQRLWPRASAVAEKLWSPACLTGDTDSAAFRLDQQRCRMLRRGIPAEPILNGYCGDYEWEMD